ncbi:MAG: retroviral-like aspartic protease family protein [Dehalococcoidia bacterium]|nr:retroviral-like aspartic protease family protein [Dehalococcoidia bacterium]
MQHSYSRRFDPSAPVLTISLGVPFSPEMVQVETLIDSGSDMAVVPERIVEQLQLRHADYVTVSGLELETREIPVYAVTVNIEGVFSPTIQGVIAWEKDYSLLGRDVLNSHVVILDGPNRQLEVRA